MCCTAAGLFCAAPSAQAAVGGPAAAQQAGGQAFVPYASFISATASARYRSFAAASAGGGVRGVQAFGQMRSYILATYRDVKVEHSFVYSGSYFDCVTIRSQPTVRDRRIATIATPPSAVTAGRRAAASRAAASQVGASRAGRAAPSALSQGLRDSFGNAISCPAASIPMLRITLGAMTRFPTVAAYLAKEPGGQKARQPVTPGGPHRYAFGSQSVTNYGGNSWLNLWNPAGDFTLSQQWYANGSGAGTQTVEGGWVHYPAKFGSNSVLFIFSTPNDYASGCYDLECSGFVQISSAVALGGSFTNYSTYGGTQWGFGLQWKYFAGNWWMYYQGSAVGYYPGSVFHGGPMAKNAALTEYGGETYTAGNSWPQMGSGRFASAGWAQAAFQNTIFYIPQNVSGGTGVWSSLGTAATNPACYTISYTNAATGGSWGTYIYFGGPGGAC
jgi:hypothetical protein